MGWMIGRAAVLSDPEGAKRKALEKLQGLTELEDPEGDQAERKLIGRDGDPGDDEPGDVAEDLHHPDQRAGEPDLGGRHEIRHVALERPLGEVRT